MWAWDFLEKRGVTTMVILKRGMVTSCIDCNRVACHMFLEMESNQSAQRIALEIKGCLLIFTTLSLFLVALV